MAVIAWKNNKRAVCLISKEPFPSVNNGLLSPRKFDRNEDLAVNTYSC